MHLIRPEIRVFEKFATKHDEVPTLINGVGVCVCVCVCVVCVVCEKRVWAGRSYPIIRPDSPKMRVFPVNAKSSHMPACSV